MSAEETRAEGLPSIETVNLICSGCGEIRLSAPVGLFKRAECPLCSAEMVAVGGCKEKPAPAPLPVELL